MNTRAPRKQRLRQQLARSSCNVRPVAHLHNNTGRTW
jgi:hypothetical protein